MGLVMLALELWACWGRRAPAELAVAFLERNEPTDDVDQALRSSRFEQIHRAALEELVEEHNRAQSRYRLRLLPRVDPPAGLVSTGYTNYLRARYQALARKTNLVCVFDDCWGRDIAPLASQLQELKNLHQQSPKRRRARSNSKVDGMRWGKDFRNLRGCLPD